jgi:hypothetical protein
MRGGGDKRNQKSTKPAASGKPAVAPKQPAATSKASSPPTTPKGTNAKSSTSSPLTEQDKLVAEHWSVAPVNIDDLKVGSDGVALATKANYEAKANLFKDSECEIALVVPLTVEAEGPVVLVWATGAGGTVKQGVRRIVQLGRREVT